MIRPHTLGVSLHNKLIATLTYLGHDKAIFAFTEEYVEDTGRATLSLSHKDTLGDLRGSPKTTQTQLTPFFSNLLPEGRMREYLSERAGVREEREFFLLWVLGQDLPGAITVNSMEEGALPEGKGFSGGGEKGSAETPMRFSLAGVQLKFSAAQAAKGGLTISASGMGGSWIVKLPCAQYKGVPENEFAMMTLARKIGIDVPEIRMIDVADIEGVPSSVGKLGSKAFAIKRFDRTDEGKVHIEDFAQVFELYPKDKYGKGRIRNIAEVVNIETEGADNEEFVRRLVFNTLIGNADMHMKNWSLVYPDGVSPRLAPAYDFVSTIPYIPDHEGALKVSRSKAFTDFTLDELAHMAGKASMPEKSTLDTARRTVAEFRELWSKEKNHLGVPQGIVSAIDEHMLTVPIARI